MTTPNSQLPGAAAQVAGQPYFYTVREAAEMLRISPWTLNRMIQAKQIRSAQIGTRRLIPVDALSEYVAAVAGGAPAEADRA
ncbi:MAG TPA: helix-turn-helix domain-containing protein [Cellulomonas sp.]